MDQCDECRHNRSDFASVVVDGRIADQWLEFACVKEDEVTEETDLLIEQNRCPFFERCTQEELDE